MTSDIAIIPEVWVSWLAQDYLDGIVNERTRVFEWGSGGSTVWFGQHAASVVSVEHNLAWGKRVVEALKEHRIANCSLHVLPDRQQYIAKVAEDSYDFIMVDGAQGTRYQCVEAAIGRLKPGGWLVVDNSERPFAEPIHKMLRMWDGLTIRGHGPRHETGYYKITTSFWKKPAEN